MEAPATVPAKPPLPDLALTVPFYASIHVDRTGKVLASRPVRDPIPSLSADSKKSLDRWVFEPARKNGEPVETWAAVRIDLQVLVRTPRLDHLSLTPVTPSDPIPVPFAWVSDTAWYEALKPVAVTDGSTPAEQVDAPATPKKTRWDADSYKGPFSCRFWAKVNAAGRIEKSVPIQVSDPVLIAYVRQEIAGWQLRPAQIRGQPADSWNELVMTGQVAYSVSIKQIANLRKTIGVTEAPR